MITISKDEAWILAEALQDHEFSKYIHDPDEYCEIRQVLRELTKRLLISSRDKRREGRNPINEYSDCLKRYTKKHKPNDKGRNRY